MRWCLSSVQVAHAVADRRGGGHHVGNHLIQPLPGEAVGRTRCAQRGDHLAGVVAHRCGDRVESLLKFLDRADVPIPSGFFEVGIERIEAK